MAVPEASASRHPRLPHPQRGPAGWTVICPSSPPMPRAPLRAHFKTWCDRCGVSVKWTVFHVGFLHSGSVLASFRHRMEVLKCALNVVAEVLKEQHQCPTDYGI